MTQPTTGPLSTVRVVDATTGPRGIFASKLLRSLGAEVLKIEPPGGDPLRSHRPFLHGEPGLERSLRWLHFAGGLKSIVLDLDEAADRETFARLVERSDVLLENSAPGALGAIGLDFETLRRHNPALVMTSLTPFGLSGPHRDWLGSDIVGYATGGMMSLTGEPDTAPVRLGGGQADHLAGLYGAVGTLMALNHAATTGEGQHVDVSQQDAVACTLVDAGVTYYDFNGQLNPRRLGTQHPIVVPVLATPTSDGHELIDVLEPLQWRALVEWMNEAGVDVEFLEDSDYEAPMNRLPLRDVINLLVAEAAAKYTKVELYERLQSSRIPSAPVSTPADVAENAQLVARGFFRETTLRATGETVRAPGPPMGFTATPAAGPAPAPALDEHRDEILALAARPRHPATLPHVLRRGRRSGARRALDGIRVIDFSWALAGPWAGRLLAREGAEVIRVESAHRLDALRHFGPDPERAGAYINANGGKLGAAIEIVTEQGRDLALRLVAEADVVLENFRPGVMGRLGLGRDQLTAVNRSIVTCSMPAQGSTGPHREFVAYAPVLMSLAGFTHLTGFPEGNPSAVCTGFIDQLASAHAVIGILSALRHRDRTGESQHVEVSQFEAAVGMLDAAMLEFFANGTVRERDGNADPNLAPHGCYPCLGEDDWVTIAITDDSQWPSLAEVIGCSAWADNAALATADGRRAAGAEIDAAISEWTRARTPHEAANALQSAGVPGGAVQRVGDLVERDEHLSARGVYEEVDHPAMGTIRLDSSPFRLLGTPGSLRRRGGPLLGQDTRAVLLDILGLDKATVESLAEQGALTVQASDTWQERDRHYDTADNDD